MELPYSFDLNWDIKHTDAIRMMVVGKWDHERRDEILDRLKEELPDAYAEVMSPAGLEYGPDISKGIWFDTVKKFISNQGMTYTQAIYLWTNVIYDLGTYFSISTSGLGQRTLEDYVFQVSFGDDAMYAFMMLYIMLYRDFGWGDKYEVSWAYRHIMVDILTDIYIFAEPGK